MARICEAGGRVDGPFLQEMARLAHTEYIIEGPSRRDPRDILRETMFAPTVTGSPLENACRVIARYEPHGRGYYGGVAGPDRPGRRRRRRRWTRPSSSAPPRSPPTAAPASSRRRRHPRPPLRPRRRGRRDPRQGRRCSLAALASGDTPRPAHRTRPPRRRLDRRNARSPSFWLATPRPAPAATDARRAASPDRRRRGRLHLDAGPPAAGARPDGAGRTSHDVRDRFDDHDLVVLGPGPGDPSDPGDPGSTTCTRAIGQLLARRTPFLAVCLSHQLLCRRCSACRCGAGPHRTRASSARSTCSAPGTGRLLQHLRGARDRTARLDSPEAGEVHVSRDPATGEVHALRGAHFVRCSSTPSRCSLKTASACWAICWHRWHTSRRS